MIDACGINANELDSFFHQPSCRLLAQSRRVAEILLAVGIFAMPAGIDENDVARLDRRLCRRKIGRLDQSPFAFWNLQDDTRTKEAVQRQIAHRVSTRDEM